MDDIFLTDPESLFPPLAPNSIFVGKEASQAALFAAVASLIQRMRVGEAEPNMPSQNYPEISLLGTDNYLGGRFREATIRAAILRPSKVRELQTPRHENEMERASAAVNAILNDELARPLVLELLFQAKLGKLPSLRFEPAHEAVLKTRYSGYADLFLSL